MDWKSNDGLANSNGGGSNNGSRRFGNGNFIHASSHAASSELYYPSSFYSNPNQGLEDSLSRLSLHAGIDGVAINGSGSNGAGTNGSASNGAGNNGVGTNVARNNGARVSDNGDADAEYRRMMMMMMERGLPFYGSSSSFHSPLNSGQPNSSTILEAEYRNRRSINHRTNPSVQFQSRASNFLNSGLDFPEPGQLNRTDSRIERQSQWTIPDYPYQQPETRNLTSFADLKGKVVRYAMDQNGCRMLRMMFQDIRPQEFNMIFDEAIGNITLLMTDQYGNFIFQKLVEGCSVDQRTRIVAAITRNPFHLINICVNSYGTRAVQKLLTYLTTMEQKAMLMAAISPGVFQMSIDSNGHHVIVHCVKNFPYELSQVFPDIMAQFCLKLSTDQSGCCVVQSCVDHSRGEARNRLVREILSVTQLLSEDRFGNYVVQCLLRQMDQMINIRVWEELKGNFISLSCNKFGSNVVEACLEQSDRQRVDLIILEMLESPHVSTIFSDPFGNYVIQAALTVSKGAVHEALVSEIWKHAPSLESNQYGKMTLSWFDPKKRRRSMRNRSKYGSFHP